MEPCLYLWVFSWKAIQWSKIYEEAAKKAAEEQAKAKTEVEDDSADKDSKKKDEKVVDADYKVEEDKEDKEKSK